MPNAARPAEQRPSMVLPLAGFLLGFLALVPPYAGPRLLADPGAEVVDHVLPGLLVAAGCLVTAMLQLVRSRAPGLGSGLLVVLAGLWMTAAHLPLVAQAARAQVSWTPVVWHSTPGVLLLVLGAAWAALTWSAAAEVS